MNSNQSHKQHWIHVSVHFAVDAALFLIAFIIAAALRFGGEWQPVMWVHGPFVIGGALCFSATAYIFGLYSTHSANQRIRNRAWMLAVCVVLATALMSALSYTAMARPPGRGVILLGAALAYAGVFFDHLFLVRRLRKVRECVGYVVTCPFDELEMHLFNTFGGQRLELAGIIEGTGYRATGQARVLGKTANLPAIAEREGLTRILCTDNSLHNPALSRQFCQLRYAGVTVMPLISLCEEIHQCVPLELVTPDWLLHASGEPHVLYIQRGKRLFDIVVALCGLVIASPLFLLAVLAVKFTSRGPVFYRQTRSGLFGESFEIWKLRTMRTDAEKGGAVWWGGPDDPRVTLVGRFLRKYRIDELPQLFHVLAGDMSFVGPRPERPEMIERLAREIPYYRERLMVQPGITGWAQVSYPYGATVEDARRKLEYDLYYMKHMSLFLDLFILLDTVRTVLMGGLKETGKEASRQQAVSEWQELKAGAGATTTPEPRPEMGYIVKIHLGQIVKIPTPRARAQESRSGYIPKPPGVGVSAQQK